MAFVQRFEKFIHKGTQNGVQLVKIILCIPTVKHILNVDIKMQCHKIGAGINDEIGITHRIGYHKFVGFDVAFDGDFIGFVSSNLVTEIFLINILHSSFTLIRNCKLNYRGMKSPRYVRIISSLELIAWIASKFFS
jgi:hypothetical protein